MFIKVHVEASSKKSRFTRVEDDLFEIHTKEPAEGGRANREVIRQLIDYFKNPKGGLQIVSGHHHTKKIFTMRDDQFFPLKSR
jgi:uncharacterized protein (TIGR00251 family)